MYGAARRAALGAAATVAAAALAGCLGERAPAWTGTIVREGETVVVRNPAEPMLPDDSVSAERLWVVPEDALADGSASWQRPRSLVVVGDTVFALDGRSDQVHVVSLDGHWTRSFGRRGEGPGEMRAPMFIARLGDSLVVLDGGIHLQLFSRAGAPGRRIRFEEPLGQLRGSSDGSVLLTFLDVSRLAEQWRQFRPDGSLVDVAPERLGPAIERTVAASDPSCRRLEFAGGEVRQHGCTLPMVIDLDSAGRPRLRFELPASEPPALTAAARDSFRLQAAATLQRSGIPRERAELVATMQANMLERDRFWGAARDSQSGLYLLWEQESSAAGAPGALVHIFSPDGIYLARHRFPEPWRVLEFVEGDLLVTSTDTETGLERLARYRIRLSDDALARAAAVAARAAPRDQS